MLSLSRLSQLGVRAFLRANGPGRLHRDYEQDRGEGVQQFTLLGRHGLRHRGESPSVFGAEPRLPRLPHASRARKRRVSPPEPHRSIRIRSSHTQEETFKFLGSPRLLSMRNQYYASLTRLVLMDNVPGRLEMFLAPFLSMLQLLQQQQDFAQGNVTVFRGEPVRCRSSW